MRRLPLLILALLPLAAASAAAQRRTPTHIVAFRTDVPVAEDTLPYPPELVWQALPVVYAQLGLPAGPSIDAESHAYLTPYLEVRGQLFGRSNSEFFRCQEADILAAGLASNARITFAVLTRVVPGPNGGTFMRTQVDARARRRDVATSSVECTTTGRLEKALAQFVALAVQQAMPPPAP